RPSVAIAVATAAASMVRPGAKAAARARAAHRAASTAAPNALHPTSTAPPVTTTMAPRESRGHLGFGVQVKIQVNDLRESRIIRAGEDDKQKICIRIRAMAVSCNHILSDSGG